MRLSASMAKAVVKGCWRKRSLDEMTAHREAVRLEQRSYRCQFCGLWHLTSKGR